jgi:hypothetical protein
MSRKKPLSAFDPIISDPNFILILIGAFIWFAGYYALLIAPLCWTFGFTLVCLASARTALSRPITDAWFGIFLGIILQIAGYYLTFIPLIGPLGVVIGGVLVIFYAIPLALQKGDLPAISDLQKALKKDEAKPEKAEKESEPEDEVEDTADNNQ